MLTSLTKRQEWAAAARLQQICESWAADNDADLTTSAGRDEALEAVLSALGVEHRRRAYRLRLALCLISENMAREKANRHSGARRARKVGGSSERIDRQAIIVRDGSRCYICGEVVPANKIHLDHVIPLSRGGEHSARNLRVTCARCNWNKGALTPSEYLARLCGALREDVPS